MDRPKWRTPRPRPEQRPTTNVAVVNIEHVVPRVIAGDGGDWYLEIVPGVSLYAGLDTLERLTAEACACVRSVM